MDHLLSCCNYCVCCVHQGLHIAFRNQIDTGEDVAKAVRSHTSIMAAPPAGEAANLATLAPYDARAESDIDPALQPALMPTQGANGLNKPGSGSGLYPHVPGRPGEDVVLQMSDRRY